MSFEGFGARVWLTVIGVLAMGIGAGGGVGCLFGVGVRTTVVLVALVVGLVVLLALVRALGAILSFSGLGVKIFHFSYGGRVVAFR